MDLFENFEERLGEGPAPRPVQDQLRAGRRALRRRRLATVGGALGALALVGGGVAYATASPDSSPAPPPAVSLPAGQGGSAAPVPGTATPDRHVEPSEMPTAPDQPPLVHFAHGDVLAPAPGVTIRAQQGSPDLGRSFAPPGAPTAAAVVEDHGARVYLVARTIDGKTDVLTVRNRDFGTLAGFIDFARRNYADGSNRTGLK